MKKIFNKRITLIIVVSLVLLTSITVSAKSINLDVLYSCSDIFGSVSDPKSIMYILHNYVFIPVKWLVPIILIVLTTMDFAKVVFTDEKDALEKAKKNLFKRILIGVIIFFVPNILELLFGIFDQVQMRSCMDSFK